MPASSVRHSLLIGLIALTLAAGQRTGAAGVNPDNYFVLHPGPANGRTGVDPNDPYAPVDMGARSLADNPTLLVGQFNLTTGITEAWSPPPSPSLPGRPY